MKTPREEAEEIIDCILNCSLNPQEASEYIQEFFEDDIAEFVADAPKLAVFIIAARHMRDTLHEVIARYIEGVRETTAGAAVEIAHEGDYERQCDAVSCARYMEDLRNG